MRWADDKATFLMWAWFRRSASARLVMPDAEAYGFIQANRIAVDWHCAGKNATVTR